MILTRNDNCWCGSKLKYKKCHIEFDKKLNKLKEQGYEVPTRDLLKIRIKLKE